MSAVPSLPHDRALSGVPRDTSATNNVFSAGAVKSLTVKKIVAQHAKINTYEYPVSSVISASIPNSTGSDITGDTTNAGAVDLFVAYANTSGLFTTVAADTTALEIAFPFDIKSMTLVASGAPEHFLIASPYYNNDTDWVVIPGSQSPATPTVLADVTTYSSATYSLDVPHPAGVPIKIHLGGIVTADWVNNRYIHMQISVNM